MTQAALLDQLETEILALLGAVRAEFGGADASKLTRRPSPDRWNALECFAHLNSYCDVYFSQIEKAIHKAKARRWGPGEAVEYTWAGRRACRVVHPESLSRGPRRAPKRFDFQYQTLPLTAAKAFLINYEMLLRFVRQAREVDLNQPKIPSATFSLLKFRLGNLLEYLVRHAQRHVSQAVQAAR